MNYILAALMALILLGCSRNSVKIKSFDNKQEISIITKDTVRFIVPGRHFFIPDKGYISYTIPAQIYSDEFGICWDTDGYKWKMVNEGIEIIDYKLNSSLYSFSTKFDVDDRNIPTMINYMNKDCMRFVIEDNLFVRLGLEKRLTVVAKHGQYVY